MRRGRLLGVVVFLASTIGGYTLGLMRREARLNATENTAAKEVSKPAPASVAISTEALNMNLPSDVRRDGSVPRTLE